MTRFEAWKPLIEGSAGEACCAVVIIPVRNEEGMLTGALDALAAQQDIRGRRLAPGSFEVLVLLNNCTDRSADEAEAWRKAHAEFALHVAERRLARGHAHVGMARRMLMDTAWHRLRGRRGLVAILSTDADTKVAPDWIARNLAAIAAGADAVGGAIELKLEDLAALPEAVRLAYLRDREYESLVATLEDRLDPQRGDPWPRHLQHFGASLACTPEMYARAGGLPALAGLEDVAFVDRLRRAGAKLRHDPNVTVYTSSRTTGRVEVGLSAQLKIWLEMAGKVGQQRVLSAAWLAHRFSTLRELRGLWAGEASGLLDGLSQKWRERIAEAQMAGLSEPEFLARMDCDRLIKETFRGKREGEVEEVNRALVDMMSRLSEVRQQEERVREAGRLVQITT